MLTMVTKTRLRPEEAIKNAGEFFGPGGYRFEIKNQTADCASFEECGGGIEITACAEEKRNFVELFSRERDYQVKELISKIH